MPPQMQRFGGAPNNLASHAHYQQQFQGHSQAHAGGLPPPSLAANPAFMNANSLNHPFAGSALGVGNFGSGLGMPGGTGLASQAAQMGFNNAAVHQQAHNGMGEHGARTAANKGRIREVWRSNLQEEMANLRNLVAKYPYIAMDTEFPGVVARPMGQFNGKSDYHYQCLRCNVDLLKIIQLGITLFNEDGESPPASMDFSDMPGPGRKYGTKQQIPHTWQFNFKFSLETDMFAQASIEALQSAQVDFDRLDKEGIDPFDFGALLIGSGLVCDEDVHWISFHGGYDFGYLTKVLLRLPLPDDEVEFDRFMKKFFPSIYDIKFLMKHAIRQNQMGQMTPLDAASAEILAKFEQKQGLESLADSFKVKRQGHAHQAGSDSLLTGKCFFKMQDKIFKGEVNDDLIGMVWGLGVPDHGATAQQQQQSTPQHYHQQLQENSTPQQNGYANGTPSTPNTGNAHLVGTPVHNSNGGGIGPLTPGGGGGVFGAFQFNSKQGI
ncbi:ribonuclease H-like domain-containing protein [Amylocarpus encephaloides]|uniref:poly(A)-specific ribonuclease n=1 Tax=Amylocarpus encephaloides TaxID=45428 RepID=A0A9P8C940_9HELO|nr:ribonuclease H-like domain-containing protein [Amylocarpus encephaloides]